jgi:hypothetical protein
MSEFKARGVGRMDCLVAVGCLSLLGMQLSCGVGAARESARRAQCMNNCRQIAIAILNYETSTRFFPTVSMAEFGVAPGNDSDDENPSYSWLLTIFPYMESNPLYGSIYSSSEKFAKAPFGVRVTRGGKSVSPATIQIGTYICPSFAGKAVVDVSSSDYKADPDAGGAPALTNYFALSASHLERNEKDGWSLAGAPADDAPVQGNGVLVFLAPDALKVERDEPKTRSIGIGIADLHDGSGNTIMFAESREQGYAAWFDGQVGWLVAAWPRNATEPQELASPTGPDPMLGWPADKLAGIRSPLAHQSFAVDDDAAGVYLPDAMWSGTKDRKFGPSGNHPGVAIHTFADASCHDISDDLDATVYLHLVTRAGHEDIDANAF